VFRTLDLGNGMTQLSLVNCSVLALLSCIILVTLMYTDFYMVTELNAGEVDER